MIVLDLVRLEFGMVFASVFQHVNDGEFEQLGFWLAFRLLPHLAWLKGECSPTNELGTWPFD